MEGRAKRQAQPGPSSPAGTTVKCRQNRGQVPQDSRSSVARICTPRRMDRILWETRSRRHAPRTLSVPSRTTRIPHQTRCVNPAGEKGGYAKKYPGDLQRIQAVAGTGFRAVLVPGARDVGQRQLQPDQLRMARDPVPGEDLPPRRTNCKHVSRLMAITGASRRAAPLSATRSHGCGSIMTGRDWPRSARSRRRAKPPGKRQPKPATTS